MPRLSLFSASALLTACLISTQATVAAGGHVVDGDAAKPDLIAELTLPMSQKIIVRNIGAADAGSSLLVVGCRRGRTAATDSRPDCPPFTAKHERTVPGFWYSRGIPIGPLAPGQSQSVDFPGWNDIKLEKLEGPTAFIFHVEADFDKEVSEKDEENNAAESNSSLR